MENGDGRLLRPLLLLLYLFSMGTLHGDDKGPSPRRPAPGPLQHRGQRARPARSARGAPAFSTADSFASPRCLCSSRHAPRFDVGTRLRPSSPNSPIPPRGKKASGSCVLWNPGPGYATPRIRSHSIHIGGARTAKGQGSLAGFSCGFEFCLSACKLPGVRGESTYRCAWLMNFKPFKLKTRINNGSDWAWCSGYGGQRWGAPDPHIRAAEVTATSLATTSQMTQQGRRGSMTCSRSSASSMPASVDDGPTAHPPREHGPCWAVLHHPTQRRGALPAPPPSAAHLPSHHLLSDSTGHTCDRVGLVGGMGAGMSKTGRCALKE